MNLTERIDLIIGLLDAGKPPSEIKGHILAVREQIEAYAKTADELESLKKENATLIAENQNLKNPSPPNYGGSPRMKTRTEP